MKREGRDGKREVQLLTIEAANCYSPRIDEYRVRRRRISHKGSYMHSEPTAAELGPLVTLLERLAADRELLASLPDEQRKQLSQATSKLAFPDRAARRQLAT